MMDFNWVGSPAQCLADVRTLPVRETSYQATSMPPALADLEVSGYVLII